MSANKEKIILQNDQMHRTSGQCEYVMPMMTMPCDLGLEGRHGAALKFNELDGRLLFGESYTETILKPKCDGILSEPELRQYVQRVTISRV